MNNIFNIKIEFNQNLIHETLYNKIKNKEKGYICVVDTNVITRSFKDESYNKIINDSTLNVCDGSSIAIFTNILYKTKYTAYNGPTIFSEYTKKNFKQLVLGNTKDSHEKLRLKFQENNINLENFTFKELPFQTIDNFNYEEIAYDINNNEYDIVWVSLGAPKQEQFISKLYPFINKGICIAIGGAVNLYLDDYDSKKSYRIANIFHILWILRFLQQPIKQGKRILDGISLWPSLLISEYKKKKKNSKYYT